MTNDNPGEPRAAGGASASVLAALRGRVAADLILVSADAANRTDSLLPAELAYIERAVERRRNEFSTGRWLARRALGALGVPPDAVLQGAAREPIWPAGVVGSVTHSSSVCAVVLAFEHHYRGVGLDLELSAAPSADLAHLIVAADEPVSYHEPHMLRLVFSAKEAVYKCIFPICRSFVDFLDVAIHLDPARGTFSAVPAAGRSAPAELVQGAGLYEWNREAAAALFAIPNRAIPLGVR
jgi:4'-phosphopantetheinyl transferase EntD